MQNKKRKLGPHFTYRNQTDKITQLQIQVTLPDKKRRTGGAELRAQSTEQRTTTQLLVLMKELATCALWDFRFAEDQ